MLTELQEVIYTNFNDIDSAFIYFVKKANKANGELSNLNQISLSFQDFKSALESLLPKRFTYSDLSSLWNKITNGEALLTYTLFSAFLNANKFQKSEKNTKYEL